MEDSEKRDFFEAIKNGALWHQDKIVAELRIVLAKNPLHIGSTHSIRWDSSDKFYYIYDNECYLFISNDLIELRCDRDNVFSSHKTIAYPIKNANDVGDAYERFLAMTMEDEE